MDSSKPMVTITNPSWLAYVDITLGYHFTPEPSLRMALRQERNSSNPFSEHSLGSSEAAVCLHNTNSCPSFSLTGEVRLNVPHLLHRATLNFQALNLKKPYQLSSYNATQQPCEIFRGIIRSTSLRSRTAETSHHDFYQSAYQVLTAPIFFNLRLMSEKTMFALIKTPLWALLCLGSRENHLCYKKARESTLQPN